jgi:hypothetical protein
MENPEDNERTRLLMAIIASLLLVFLGWYLFACSDHQHLFPPRAMKLIGIVAMAFFGGAAIIGLTKYFSKHP